MLVPGTTAKSGGKPTLPTLETLQVREVPSLEDFPDRESGCVSWKHQSVQSVSSAEVAGPVLLTQIPLSGST